MIQGAVIRVFLIKYLYQERMCYLKNLASVETLDLDELMHKGDDLFSEQTEMEANVLIPCVQKHEKPQWSQQQQMLVNLFQMIEKNNTLIRAMQKSLTGPSEYLEKNSIQTVKPYSFHLSQSGESFKPEEIASSALESSSTLCSRLFGPHKYKYHLQLAEQFPKIIYKERNFNLSIKLVDSSNKVIRNCNILNLCCAVSTSQAEWIHQNRVGQPFMKGKTEVELYKGEASFIKLYARDVSRVYPQGKVNLVIYSKPSALLYAGSNSFQILINSEDIEPLIVEDLTIKAKKKQ